MKPGLLIGVWLASTVAAFWMYEGRYRLPVPTRRAERPAMGRSLKAPEAKATLLAFYDPGCPCSRFALPHVRDLAKRFGPRGLDVVLVIEGSGGVPQGLASRDDRKGEIARAFGVPAAPGAVALDAAGKPFYVGGFNVARFCDDGRTAFAEQAIASFLDGHRPARTASSFYGCAMAASEPSQ